MVIIFKNEHLLGLSPYPKCGNLNKLQKVQNSAARLLRNNRTEPSNNIFTEFHWLKINERILYKITITVHNCLHDKAPASLRKLLNFAISDRGMKLREYKINSSYGRRSFSYAGPKLWNLIPLDIRLQSDSVTFKKKLKSYLFTNNLEFANRINMR